MGHRHCKRLEGTTDKLWQSRGLHLEPVAGYVYKSVQESATNKLA